MAAPAAVGAHDRYDDDYAPRSYYYVAPAPVYVAPPVVYVAPPPPVVYAPPPVYGYRAPRAVPAPEVYVEVPARPTSCGKYHYWNGDYCADARRERPYTGPRW